MAAEQEQSEQYRVLWTDRAAYLSVLGEFKRAIDRECDAVQVGAPPTLRFAQLLSEILDARLKYGCRVQEVKKASETTPAK